MAHGSDRGGDVSANRAQLAIQRLREGWPSPDDLYWQPFVTAYVDHAMADRVHVMCQEMLQTYVQNGTMPSDGIAAWIVQAEQAKAQALAARNASEVALWQQWYTYGARRSRRRMWIDWLRVRGRSILKVATFRSS